MASNSSEAVIGSANADGIAEPDRPTQSYASASCDDLPATLQYMRRQKQMLIEELGHHAAHGVDANALA